MDRRESIAVSLGSAVRHAFERRTSSYLGISRQTHIYLDSPVVTFYAGACALVTAADEAAAWLWPNSARLTFRFFAAQPLRFFDPLSPLSYWRLVGHSFAFGDSRAMAGAVALVLLTGPHCESHYGSRALLQLGTTCSLLSGVLHTLLVSTSSLMGAQDIIFMLILLNSISVYRFDRVPLTFLLTCAAFLCKEVLEAFREDEGDGEHVAHASHIIAGLLGGLAGLVLSRDKQKRKLKRFANAMKKPTGGGSGGGSGVGRASGLAGLSKGLLRSGMSIYGMDAIGEAAEGGEGESEDDCGRNLASGGDAAAAADWEGGREAKATPEVSAGGAPPMTPTGRSSTAGDGLSAPRLSRSGSDLSVGSDGTPRVRKNSSLTSLFAAPPEAQQPS